MKLPIPYVVEELDPAIKRHKRLALIFKFLSFSKKSAVRSIQHKQRYEFLAEEKRKAEEQEPPYCRGDFVELLISRTSCKLYLLNDF